MSESPGMPDKGDERHLDMCVISSCSRGDQVVISFLFLELLQFLDSCVGHRGSVAFHQTCPIPEFKSGRVFRRSALPTPCVVISWRFISEMHV